ncbi:MAG TPA: ISAs1 family transposase [Candidatus Limnocylindria bacterium]|nr:ISAs1 family transposase [Candidatus Limnocylindria bacterium]
MIRTHFADLEDPRIDRTRRHELLDIVVIAVCAVICGAEGWVDIADYGVAKQVWLRTFLRLPQGIPSHDTFRRVFCLLDPAAFVTCFQSWIEALSAGLGLKRIAIDGKTVRRSFDRATGKAALHLVSAWATEQHLVLGQVAVDTKSNEITAIPRLLELLDVSGAIVTLDAMGCQKEIAAQIRAGGGDYVLSVKDNQPHLFDDIQGCFARALDSDFAGLRHSVHEEVYTGHGRVETQQVYTILHPEGIRDQALWKDLQAITMIYSQRQQAGQEDSEEVRYYIGSKAAKASAYAGYVRGHWGIENGLHWVLDVSFDEDRSRMRTDHSAENMALLRRLALSVLKQHGGKGSVRGKRKRSGWNDQLLIEILSGN